VVDVAGLSPPRDSCPPCRRLIQANQRDAERLSPRLPGLVIFGVSRAAFRKCDEMNELLDPQEWVRRAAAGASRDVVAILRKLEGYRDCRQEVRGALLAISKRLRMSADETDSLLESVPYRGQREWIAWLAGEAESAAWAVAG
jgi:hypothetical protein